MEKSLSHLPHTENSGTNIYCLLDIDNFSLFNFSNTYEKGNLVLQDLESLINKLVKPHAFIRLGSDEYFFCCLNDFETNSKTLFRFMQMVEAELKITVSIGISEFIRDFNFESDLWTLKRNLQIAKYHGKNKICFQ